MSIAGLAVSIVLFLFGGAALMRSSQGEVDKSVLNQERFLGVMFIGAAVLVLAVAIAAAVDGG